MLRDGFSAERHHLARELSRVEQNDAEVIMHFFGGSSATGNLLVRADGFRSSVRAQLLPDAAYAPWCRLVTEAALSPATHRDIFDNFAFCEWQLVYHASQARVAGG